MARPLALLLGVLLACAAGTALLRHWSVEQVQSQEEAERLRRVSRSFEIADASFQTMQRTMVAVAEDIARSSVVHASLRSLATDVVGESDAAVADLVDYFAAVRLPALHSVELYTPTPRLVAWNGLSMPLDRAPEEAAFLQTFQTTVTLDAVDRGAIVLWWPVREGPRVYGAVRVVRIVQSNNPIQNEYVRNYDVARDWRRRAELNMELYLDGENPQDTTGAWRILSGIDGTQLSQVRTVPPSLEEMVRVTRERYDSVLALWWVLIAGLFVAAAYRAFEASRILYRRGLVVRWLVFAGTLWAWRIVLIAVRFPARLQQGRAPLSQLFDPHHFASDLFGGIIQTSGDLLLTSFFMAATAVTFFQLAIARGVRRPDHAGRAAPLRIAIATGSLVCIAGCILAMVLVARSVVLDSTLEYFARTGLMPEPHVLVVFGATLVLAASAVTLCFAFAIIALRNVSGISAARRRGRGFAALTLRNTLFAVFVLAVLVYPLLHSGVLTQRRTVLVDAAETFGDGSDPRVVFSLERILEAASADSQLVALLESPATQREELDSIATVVLRSSLLATLRSYEVSLTFVDSAGQPSGRYYEADQQVSTAALEQFELADFLLLRAMLADAGGQETLVEQITGRHERERFRYLGLRPVRQEDRILGWVMAGAEPHSTAEEVGAPFPRVFVSTGFYGGIREDVSLAEFRDGVLVRTTGTSFGRFRLETDVAEALVRSPSVWRTDRSRGRAFDTYYARRQGHGSPFAAEQSIVVAARTPSTSIFDHLYALLRLTVAGMFVGIPLYLVGLVVRRKRGLLPAPRVKFRDKVLNAFFGVGLVTVAAMGFVGLRVVTDEGDRAVDSWLRQHLERVERTLAADARAGELPYRVLDRISLDSLSARVGLDLNLFQGTELVASSRPLLARDRLIDSRLPIDAYLALNFEGFRFISSEQTVGSFAYTAGYRALPDELGRPRYVVSVPTLPEQDRLDEERARTVAYLFGALLLLVLVVLATASLLANALTRPIARLRVGLQAVAQGRYESIQPVNTRDEFGDLVDTFNTMQGQLSDQRRRLSQQERQLAWQEMARQVAHEIKNPLTPMKLSVQHLQRSLESSDVEDEEFKAGFGRITRTLVEQIDALARIASEFASFARMPRQVFEPVDVNNVLREATALMESDAGIVISGDYADEPLVVSADREELRRAFINLLKNAAQAVQTDRTPRIRVRTSRIEDEGVEMILCQIEDNGVGIPEELRDHIFEPNFSTKTSGTGLGLAIVRKAVEDMQGTIVFETEPGVGTTFSISLPAV